MTRRKAQNPEHAVDDARLLAMIRAVGASEKADEAELLARIEAAANEAFARGRRRVTGGVLALFGAVGYLTGATVFGPAGRGAIASLLFTLVVVLLVRWGLREDDLP